MPRHTLPALCLTFLLACLAGAAMAQEPAPAAPQATSEEPAQPANAITLTRIAEQQQSTEKLLVQAKALAVQPLEFEELKDRLAVDRKKLSALQKDSALNAQSATNSVEQIQNNQNVWKIAIDVLAKEQQLAKDRSAELEKGIALLAEEEKRWEEIQQLTGDAPELADGSKVVKRARADLTAARKQLGIPLQEALAVSREWQELIETANTELLTLKQQEDNVRKQLLSTRQDPLWKMGAQDFRFNQDYTHALDVHWRLSRYYLLQYPFKALIILASAIGMLVFLWRLRLNSERAGGQQSGLNLRLPLYDRPLSTTVATSVALALVLYQNPPQLLQSVMAWLLFIPAVRLGMSRLPVIVRPFAWLVSIFFLVNSFSLMIEAIPGLQRLWIVSCAFISLGVCLHALRRLAASEDRDSLAWKLLRTAVWLATLAALTAVVAGIAGGATLAQFLVTGVSNSAYAGFCMVVVAGIFTDLTVAAIYLPRDTTSHLLSHNRPMLVGRSGKLITIVCTLAWIHFTLNQFMLADILWEFVRRLLNSQLTVGNLAISLGDVLAVVVTVWLSYKISQLLRFIFIEDIAPRTKMARGVPDAIATLMHYCIILVGFMMAISAAGIDMSKLAIMVGALGVGIGIGLQDVVNNFTSGLILLVEQHIKQGDIIQCSTVNGRVIHIGLRSSVVRTFDGAEVIVPNGQLVSAQVINWTHSDQQRRITIPVGVAYGSDPDQVIRILIASARADVDVLSDPEPTAFFLRFGANSMDFELKAWVTSGEILNEVTSRLCVGVYKQLEMAGIQIPFPQQDIYIRSLPAGFSGKG